MAIKAGFNIPFKDAVDYFEHKLKLPTSDYTDIYAEQHNHAFVVAGATSDALVEDFYNALHKGLTQGTGLKEFQADFDTIVETHGWSHHGSAGWRSKLIYDTNIRQAYNAGKYQQMISVAHLRPVWIYRHHSVVNPRIAHQYLDGLTLAADNPVWQYIMPQNGYGCQCTVDSYSMMEAQAEWEKSGATGLNETPGIRWEDKQIGTTGSNPRTVKVPIISTAKGDVAIDPGFAYNPGKGWLEPHSPRQLAGYDAVLATRQTAFPAGTVRPVLPTGTAVKPSVLLTASTPPAEAVEGFLNVFGADLEKGAVFEDAVGMPVAVTKRLFADEMGSFAAVDAGQIQSMNLMAMALVEPDEIWWHWEQDHAVAGLPDVGRRWRLKRRYLRTFNIDGKGESAVVAFEWSRSKGWSADTAFVPKFDSDVEKSLDSLRVGRLVYSKDGK